MTVICPKCGIEITEFQFHQYHVVEHTPVPLERSDPAPLDADSWNASPPRPREPSKGHWVPDLTGYSDEYRASQEGEPAPAPLDVEIVKLETVTATLDACREHMGCACSGIEGHLAVRGLLFTAPLGEDT